MTYNAGTDSHAVFRVRRVSQAEAEKTLYLQWQDSTLSGTPTTSHCQSSSLRQSGVSLQATPSRLHSTNSPSQSRSLTTPFTPFISRSNSPSQSRPQSRAGSGSPLNTMASMLRTGDRLGQTSPARFSSPNRSVNSGDDSLEDNPQPLQVSLCFDQLWTEPPNGKEVAGRGSKVFLASDLVEQNLICILRSGPSPGLQLVKMETVNDNPDLIIFGAVKRIPCRDAVPLSGLNMILVLELTGSLSLYSGTTRVSKILLSPSPATILSHEISALALDNLPGSSSSPHLSSEPSLSSPCTPLNYKRSSLLTSSRPPSAALPTFGNPDSTTGFLSPVTADPAGQISGLRDPGPHSACLQLSSSRLVRVCLPAVAGHTVGRALAAIKLLLPRELATLLHLTWYNDRHAPGPCPAPDKEWDMFCRTILALAGYQVDCLDLSSASNCSGPVAAKKSKKCEESGCDNDWQQLLLSAHHAQAGDSVSRLLGLDHPLPQSQPAPAGESKASQQVAEVNRAAPLFLYLPAMFWSLHLLYEEAKLDSALFPCQPRLAGLLSQLAEDLEMTEYQHHYWRDFPSSALSPGTSRQSQLSPAALARLSPAPLMTSRPPSILSHLRLVCGGGRPEEAFPLLSGVTDCCQLLTLALSTLSTPGPPQDWLDSVVRQVPQPGRALSPLSLPAVCKTGQESLALFLSSQGWDLLRLSSLPPSLSVPLLTGLAKCQVSPPSGWPAQAYSLIGRDDLAASSPAAPPLSEGQLSQDCDSDCDGLEGVLSDVSRARWPEDQRLQEARRLLQSSRPVTIPVTQRPEVSDHDFLEEQEHYLKRLCERTMALSVGRGVAALRTVASLPTEILDIPKVGRPAVSVDQQS